MIRIRASVSMSMWCITPGSSGTCLCICTYVLSSLQTFHLQCVWIIVGQADLFISLRLNNPRARHIPGVNASYFHREDGKCLPLCGANQPPALALRRCSEVWNQFQDKGNTSGSFVSNRATTETLSQGYTVQDGKGKIIIKKILQLRKPTLTYAVLAKDEVKVFFTCKAAKHV